MIELGLVLGLLGTLVGSALILTHVGWELMLIGGTVLIVAGLGVGVPAGAIYHVLLHRAARALLPALWWLHPTRHHDLVPSGPRRAVLVWCYIGAGGWAVAVLGCALVALGAFLGR